MDQRTNNWTDQLVDKRAITAIFGDHVPSLTGIELVELIIDNRGPRLRLRFNLPEFPDNPPKKWLEKKANTVQLSISASDVRELSVLGAAEEMFGTLTLSREEEGVRIKVDGDDVRVDCLADWVLLDQIGAYGDRRRIPGGPDLAC